MTMNASPEQRLAEVWARIRAAERDAGRPSGSVSLLGASKAQTAATVRALAAAGQRAFGENFLQEAAAKIDELSDLELEWHFIGRIQSNKTREIAARFDWVHSLDRLRIARRLNDQRPVSMPPLSVCIEVNFDGEESKGGIGEQALSDLAHAVAGLERLRLRGLMAVPPPSPDSGRQRAAFARVREAAQRLQDEGLALDTLSMGMSDDLESAIAEGATLVRIGTALFGPRPPKTES